MCGQFLHPNHLKSTPGTSFWHTLEPAQGRPGSHPRPGSQKGQNLSLSLSLYIYIYIYIYPHLAPKFATILKSPPLEAILEPSLEKSSKRTKLPTSSKSLKLCFHTRGGALKWTSPDSPKKVSTWPHTLVNLKDLWAIKSPTVPHWEACVFFTCSHHFPGARSKPAMLPARSWNTEME